MKHLLCLLGLHDWRLIPHGHPGECLFLCPRCGEAVRLSPPLDTAIDASMAAVLPAPAPARRRPRLSVAVERSGLRPAVTAAMPDAKRARAIAGVEDFAQAFGGPARAPVRGRDEDSRAASSGGTGPSPDASAEAAVSGTPRPSDTDPVASDMPPERDRPLPPKRAALLRLLIEARGPDGICRATNRELGNALGCSNGGVVKPLAKLETDGWIARTGSTKAREIRVLYSPQAQVPASPPAAEPEPEPAIAGSDDEDPHPVPLSPMLENLLNEIISLTDESGTARPTNAALASALEMEANAVSARLKILDDRGYVGRSHDGEGRAIHVLRWPDGEPFVADAEDQDDEAEDVVAEPEPEDETDGAEELQAPSKVRDRNCLTCGKVFRSEGPHNRMCGSCRHKSEDSAGDPHVLHGGRR